MKLAFNGGAEEFQSPMCPGRVMFGEKSNYKNLLPNLLVGQL
jgi:hypothetical protein